ncbi:hypothetical protein K443DRAFT_645268, partial [Laccaria amethystina LaAM-08-1]
TSFTALPQHRHEASYSHALQGASHTLHILVPAPDLQSSGSTSTPVWGYVIIAICEYSSLITCPNFYRISVVRRVGKGSIPVHLLPNLQVLPPPPVSFIILLKALRTIKQALAASVFQVDPT